MPDGAAIHHVGNMLLVSNALIITWGLAVDPLLTGQSFREEQQSRRLRSWERGARAAAGTLRKLATEPWVIEGLRSDPTRALEAIATGIEQGVAEAEG